MASIITHPAIPLAISMGLGSGIISRPLLVAGGLFSIMPDLDVIAYPLGVLDGPFAHRGFTHAIFFALICGGLAAPIAPALEFIGSDSTLMRKAANKNGALGSERFKHRIEELCGRRAAPVQNGQPIATGQTEGRV